MANLKVFEVDLGSTTSAIYTPMLKGKGVSGAANARIAKALRPALKRALVNTVEDAVNVQGFKRSRNAYNIMRTGIRVFGSSVSNMRGHIIGPEYVLSHENGSTIRPKQSAKLAIPILFGVRSDGTPKLPRPRSWKGIKQTFVYVSKRTGESYLAYRDAGAELKIIYLLVDEVVLTKHKGFLSNAWSKQKEELIGTIGEVLTQEFNRIRLGNLSGIASRR